MTCLIRVKITDKEFNGRCAVYDVETKQLLAGGSVHINKNL